MVTRRQLLQGIIATTAIGLCPPLSASKRVSHFLKPGEKLKPGEYVWEPELSPEGPVAIVVSLPEQMVHMLKYQNGLDQLTNMIDQSLWENERLNISRAKKWNL